MTLTDSAVQNATSRVFRHVLHPTNFSADGAVAFAHALKLALLGRADLSIVHTAAGREVGEEWRAFPQVRETLTQWGLLPAGAPPAALADLGLHIHKSDIGADEPGKAIAHFADKHDCDLMVLATHPRHGLERWTRPSVAEPLARRTGLPTLFLPDNTAGFIDAATGAATLEHILLPVEASPDPGRALALATTLAKALGSQTKIHLLHVGADRPVITAPAETDILWHDAEGGVVDAICKTADDIAADLIVMTTHGHDGFLDALRGSTTEQVLRRAGRALLAVPMS